MAVCHPVTWSTVPICILQVFKDHRLHSFYRFFDDSLCRLNVYTGRGIYFLFVIPTVFRFPCTLDVMSPLFSQRYLELWLGGISFLLWQNCTQCSVHKQEKLYMGNNLWCNSNFEHHFTLPYKSYSSKNITRFGKDSNFYKHLKRKEQEASFCWVGSQNK